MSPSRIGLVGQFVDALNARDWDTLTSYVTDDVVIDNTRALADQGGLFTGPDEGRRLWELMTEVWESVEVRSERVTEVGDHLVVAMVSRNRGRQEIEVEARWTWSLGFRGDKMDRIVLFQDEQEALDLARASPG